MSAQTTLRDTLNTADPNNVDRAMQDIALGDLLALVIQALPDTEAGVSISSHVATLAAQPSTIFQVEGLGGTSGIKKLLKGFTAPDGTIQPVPAVGQVTWDGGLKLRFNAADANTTCDVAYAKADGSDKASILLRSLGESDT